MRDASILLLILSFFIETHYLSLTMEYKQIAKFYSNYIKQSQWVLTLGVFKNGLAYLYPVVLKRLLE